ncbi:hypothetical protein Cni_G12752 [Canna indica]|uniref:Uncharacterized protein n=1 Tax=Canna indica TaxID=4628 RepID=A0AAQ3KE22_9LILI|nr:hypothetical protein Cni_G12752 [Canna indica]
MRAWIPPFFSPPKLSHSHFDAVKFPADRALYFLLASAPLFVPQVLDRPPAMAITHNDLSMRTQHWRRDVGSRLALLLVFLSVLCGLISFVLCLAAEASRSEATWYLMSNRGDGNKSDVCVFTSSGRTPLACAVCAFLLLAFAMFAEHAYMLVAVTSPKHPAPFVSWSTTPAPTSTLPDDPRTHSSTARSLTWQACCLFLTTWICFAIAEVLLIIGIGVESGHISQWRRPKPDCHVIRPGLFAAAGIFGLITVLLGVGLYLTALQTQRLHQEEENGRRTMPHAADPHHFPPPSAPPRPSEAAHHQGQAQGVHAIPDKTSTSA